MLQTKLFVPNMLNGRPPFSIRPMLNPTSLTIQADAQAKPTMRMVPFVPECSSAFPAASRLRDPRPSEYMRSQKDTRHQYRIKKLLPTRQLCQMMVGRKGIEAIVTTPFQWR